MNIFNFFYKLYENIYNYFYHTSSNNYIEYYTHSDCKNFYDDNQKVILKYTNIDISKYTLEDILIFIKDEIQLINLKYIDNNTEIEIYDIEKLTNLREILNTINKLILDEDIRRDLIIESIE